VVVLPFLLFWSKYILDNSFPRRGVAVHCEHAAINKLSKAGKVGGPGPRRDRGIGRKKDHWSKQVMYIYFLRPKVN
jgi:hypothetical protein